MSEVFVDSHYWLAVLNPRDSFHAAAMALPRPAKMATTAAVLVEVMDAMSAAPIRSTAALFWRQIATVPNLVVVPWSDQLIEAAVRLYEQRPDKGWSLTDCISFTVMKDRGLSEALTADHHFQQAGFVALL